MVLVCRRRRQLDQTSSRESHPRDSCIIPPPTHFLFMRRKHVIVYFLPLHFPPFVKQCRSSRRESARSRHSRRDKMRYSRWWNKMRKSDTFFGELKNSKIKISEFCVSGIGSSTLVTPFCIFTVSRILNWHWNFCHRNELRHFSIIFTFRPVFPCYGSRINFERPNTMTISRRNWFSVP